MLASIHARVLALGPSFMQPDFWLEKAGRHAVWAIVAIIFAESGLFFGFFLPGDSLLFMAGFLTSSGAHHFVEVGAAGDQVGYWFGKRVGPALFTRDDSRLFKQSHVRKAHDFLEKYGPKTILLARFVPIVRTFAPIVAGVGEMKYRTFITYNLIGALIWSVGVTLLGHFLGNIGFVRDNIEFAIIGIVLLSLTPVFVELVKHRREAKAVLEGQV